MPSSTENDYSNCWRNCQMLYAFILSWLWTVSMALWLWIVSMALVR
jgi:hypothetical protein